MKILFLGGKKILGRAIIEKLAKVNDIKLFNLSRTKSANFYKNITHLKGDRNNTNILKNILKENDFDIVFDNNCYEFKSFKTIFEVIKNKKIFYIFTSSIITYLNFNNIKVEKDSFNKEFLKLNKYLPKKLSYNKKRIELYLLNQKKVKFSIIKMHNLIGKNDHSNKTEYLQTFNEFYLSELKIKKDAFLQFAYINDVTQIIFKLIERLKNKKKVFNIYNIANDPLSIKDLLKINKNNKKKYKNINKEIIEDLIVSNIRVKRNLNFRFTKNNEILKKIKKLKN